MVTVNGKQKIKATYESCTIHLYASTAAAMSIVTFVKTKADELVFQWKTIHKHDLEIMLKQKGWYCFSTHDWFACFPTWAIFTSGILTLLYGRLSNMRAQIKIDGCQYGLQISTSMGPCVKLYALIVPYT